MTPTLSDAPAASSPAELIAPSFDRSRHAAPQVFEHLRELIVAMRIAPGTVLQRAELAALYGLSQTPIRDALIRLGEEGLVDIFPQHATVVSSIDVPLARQQLFLRRSIELEIVHRLASAPSAPLLGRLADSIELQRMHAARENYVEFVHADEAFHKLMYDAAEVMDLWTLVRRQSGHLDRLRNLHVPIPGKTERVLEQHAAIVAAIAAGNPEAAQEALRAHLSGTLSQVDEIRARFGGFLKN
ncbi:GntR family transcriptional regulator [Burkholderia gladioli]|uniref:GntR family transcriptional regulator n=1 Tax=Burkholderia gladioli TaxID=28095 RepID=UPI0009E25D4E|nr:GntR family transcriptional regulator [Burkholderia gladioli]MDN7604634.1 GntR family transcriptional regulator [Burkholderia gladioli]MDN7720352.1 GntR family transcriptional regulator [Burkholderia gladioli]